MFPPPPDKVLLIVISPPSSPLPSALYISSMLLLKLPCKFPSSPISNMYITAPQTTLLANLPYLESISLPVWGEGVKIVMEAACRTRDNR